MAVTVAFSLPLGSGGRSCSGKLPFEEIADAQYGRIALGAGVPAGTAPTTLVAPVSAPAIASTGKGLQASCACTPEVEQRMAVSAAADRGKGGKAGRFSLIDLQV